MEIIEVTQPTTVRACMYQLVSHRLLHDTSLKSYRIAQRLLVRMRDCGVIPWYTIVDNVRRSVTRPAWSGLSDYADDVAESYRLDFWRSLENYVEVVVEKDAVVGLVKGVCDDWRVPLSPLKGYASLSFLWSIAQLWKEIEKPITVLYIGDHDPSGRDLEIDASTKLAEYSGREFAWRRLGLLPEQFQQFNIVSLDRKVGDARSAAFLAEFGDQCAEVEAIPSNELRNLLHWAIEDMLTVAERARWQSLLLQEEREREGLKQFVANFGEIVNRTTNN